MQAQERWKCAAALGWSLIGVVLLAGASTRNEIRARRLVIEDEKGRDRIVLQTLDGLPSATFYDTADVPRLYLMLTEGGNPDISLHDGKERTRIALTVCKGEGEPIIELKGPEDGSGIRLGVADESALIDVRNGQGKSTLIAPPAAPR